MSLSFKQRRFVAEYLKDQNASQAAIRAGYSKKNCDVVGPRLLGYVGIKAEIQKKIGRIEAQVEVSIVDVIRELKKIAFLDMRKAFDENGDLLPPSKWPDEIAHALSGVDKEKLFEGIGQDREQIGNVLKIRTHSKTESLKMLGQHLKMFTDKVEHSIDDNFSNVLNQAIQRANVVKR